MPTAQRFTARGFFDNNIHNEMNQYWYVSLLQLLLAVTPGQDVAAKNTSLKSGIRQNWQQMLCQKRHLPATTHNQKVCIALIHMPPRLL